MFQKQISFHLILILALGMVVAGCMVANNPPSVIGHPCVAGGKNDSACNVVQGYGRNDVSPNVTGATISGGGGPNLPNRVTGDYGTIGGGLDNIVGDRATVAGGSHNIANGFRAVVGGGSSNTASGAYSTLGGGENNVSNYYYTTVSGGSNNTASGRMATVGGGSGNSASFTLATVSGGANNTASGLESTVGGGSRNRADGTYATISGGSGNVADSLDATIGGGSGNIVTGHEGTIGGGLVNIAGGSFSAIPGGLSNRAAGAYSVAAGRRANVRATHDGAFLYADSSDVDFDSQAANEFAVRATGGVRLVTAIDAAGNPTGGVSLAAGSGSWASLSDHSAKTSVAPVDGREILDRVAQLSVTTWSYTTQSPSIRHIGPMAQDFYAAFAVGEDDRHISTVDADGVALAAIQGLYEVVQDKDAQINLQRQRIEALENEIAAQRNQMAIVQARLAAMETKNTFSSPPVALPINWLTIAGLGVFGALAIQRRRAER
jgi:hypothetical protein